MSNDLTFFTNEEGNALYDRFKTTLKSAKYFDALVGYFRTSGFYRLYEELGSVEKIRILVGISADSKTIEIIDEAKQLNFLETHNETRKIISEAVEEEFTKSEDKYEVEQGVKKFIEFIRSGKLEIKAYPSRQIHAKVYISRYNSELLYGSVVTGSSNFSESGLNGNYEFNVELKNRSDVNYALEKFEKLWKEAVDLSEEYIETINTKTWINDEITPYELYIKLLYEYFNEDINAEAQDEIDYPSGFMKLEYQSQAVTSVNKIVESFGGAFISDVVGLSKTFITAMYAQNLKGKKLVICPPPIIENWKDAFREFGVKKYDIESIGMLDKILRKIHKSGENEYDYIFIDEAHRFRNEDTEQYRLLHEICLNKKILLITATPLNNSFYDFYSLIKLFQNPTNSDIPGQQNLKSFFDTKRYRLKQIESESGKDSVDYINAIKLISKEVRDKILRHVMIRRTRTDIVKHFSKDIEEQGLAFPKVAEPQRIIYEFDAKTSGIFDDTIQTIKELTYSRYTPALYLKEDKQLSAFEKQHEVNLKGFMKSRLVKRLESSKHAFEMTLGRFINSHKNFIKMLKSGTVYISKKVDVFDYLDNDNEEELEKFLEGGDEAKVKKYSSEQFKEEFLIDLEGDLYQLEDIFIKWKSIKTDAKLEKFVESLKIDKLLNKNKLIIFTESKETGEYLFEIINKEYENQVLFYSSSGSNSVKERIKENFDPNNSCKSSDIRILITTDVLAEGINLHRSNVVINYDLPWNPTRVLQRVGRINRVGTKHKEVYIYNFFPTGEADAELKLEDNIKAKIQAFHNALGEDARYLSEEEEFTSFNLRGAELYEKLNSSKTFNEDDEENVELKYLDIIRNIRDNEVDLYNKVKRLPKKIRACRNFKDIEKNNLITFFRKGKLKKFSVTDGNKPEEIPFEKAVKFFECDLSTKKQSLSREYYEYLEINKKLFSMSPIEEEQAQQQKGGRSNEKFVLMALRALLNENRFTQEELDYIKLIIKSFNDGIIPKKVSQKLKTELEKVSDNLKALPILRKNISNDYIYRNRQHRTDHNQTREIILSEYLIKGE